MKKPRVSAAFLHFSWHLKLPECLKMIETAKPQLKMAKNRKTAPDLGWKTRTAGNDQNRKTAQKPREKSAKTAKPRFSVSYFAEGKVDH